MKRPLVIAHRGACWEAPENTLAAFELAIEQGADYVEFDVRADAEDRLVLCHNPVPDPRPADLCTLDAALAALRGRVGLAVEIKDGRVAEPALQALRRHHCDSDSVILLSFAIRVLETMRRLRPDLRTVLNLGPNPDPVAATRFWGVGFHDAVAKPKPTRLAQSLGLATFVFTVNEPARMRELAALGVDGIFSDRPGLLRETLAALPEPARGRSRQGRSR
jgi:glycerophosphoryl diester phosphodiesterase